MKITDWAAEDRPREKMMAKGPDVLSDAELLAILLRTGIQGKSAVDLARDVLAQCHNSLSELGHALLGGDDATPLKGLGPSKRCTITAALELGRRRAAEEERRRLGATRITDSRSVFAWFNQHLSDLDHEELWALYLSNSGKVRQCLQVSEGGVSSSVADVRKIVRPAVEYLAASVVLCHNHPHSVARPSGPDREATKKVREALALFDVRLLDHVIISDGQYYSMADHGEIL